MNKSATITNIAKALLCFQSKMGKIAKESNNPFFKSKYASLPAILEQIQKPLAECGLCFSQFPDGENGLTTILMHPESGEFMEANANMHLAKSDPQALGSAITYCRRYALGAVLGLNIDDDDDGNAATPQTQPQQQASNTVTGNELPWLNEKQYKQALDRIANGETGVMDKLKAAFRMKKYYREGIENAIKAKK